MALKAGYVGVKRWLYEKLQATTSKNVQDISNIRSEQSILGARNLNATDYSKASALTNIVPTFNSDGSITVNGTTTAAETLAGGSGANFTAWYGGSVRIGEAPANVTMALYDATAGSNAGTAGQTVTMIAGHAYRLSITFAANKTFTNVTVNPLIVIASDPTTEPSAYAMTNRQLTARTAMSAEALTIASNENFELSGTVHSIRRFGNICEIYSQFKCLTSNADWTTLASAPKPYKGESVIIDIYPNGGVDTPIGALVSGTNGDFRLSGGKANKYYNVHLMYICEDAAGLSRSISDTREASPEVIADDPEPVTKTTRKSTKKEDN